MDERPTNEDVDGLAKWLHGAYLSLLPKHNAKKLAWGRLSVIQTNQYCGVARRLLTNPPVAIRKAVRSLEAMDAG